MTKQQKRELVYNKFNGLCAYSGTPLEDDWQIDHLEPVVRDLTTGKIIKKANDCIENMMPCQRLINHYKHSMRLSSFKNWILSGLHERLQDLPKNPKSVKEIRRKEYLTQIAKYFDVDENTPFCGTFYFEKINCKT